MEQKIHKRLPVIFLTAVLMINSLQLPGNIIQAVAREKTIENAEEFSESSVTDTNNTVTNDGNTIYDNIITDEKITVSGKETVSDNIADTANTTVSGNNSVSGNTADTVNITVSGDEIVTEQETDIEEENIEPQEETILSEENSEEEIVSEDTEIGAGENEILINKLVLNWTSALMNPGDTLQFTVRILPEGLDKTVRWSSSDVQVATVSEAGLVTALEEGSATITASCDGKEAVASIRVEKTDAEKNNDQPRDEEGNIIEISDEIWVAGFEKESETRTYNGNKITQDLRIYHKGTLLKEKTDYTLTYKNNVNAATYNSANAPSVTIKMKGQYSGERTLYFTIEPKAFIQEMELGYEQAVSYSKKITIPVPNITFNNRKLVNKKDFVCDYSTLPEEYTKGTSYEQGVVYAYTVKGIGNFTGSFTMQLAVIRDKTFDFNRAVVTLDKKQYEYRGEPLDENDIQIVSVKFGKQILEKNFYECRVLAQQTGSGYIEIYPSQTGRDAGYRGQKRVKIKVVGDRDIRDAALGSSWQDTIVFSKGRLLENGGICQEESNILVFGNEEENGILTEGRDYVVKYSNYKQVGTATVTFTGIGRYKGTLKKTFKIIPNTQLEIQWNEVNEKGVPVSTYVKGGAVPLFTLAEKGNGEGAYALSSKTDYTVRLTNNKKPGVMICEIHGKGNYKGYSSLTEIEVLCADIGQGTMTVYDKQYSTKKNAWKSTVTITDVNGKKLKSGTDYDKNLNYWWKGMTEGEVPKAGTVVYVTAVGKNNYEGSAITGSYRIFNTNINTLIIKIDAQEFSGKEIELSAEDIHVYANAADVKKGIELEDECYEIIRYSNNQKAGNAKVTLRGSGNYGGTKTCSFKIMKKEYLTTHVTKISLDETSVFMGVGNSRQLTASITPEDAYNKTVIWSSSNSRVATVSQNGVIKAIKPGTVTIKAVSQDTGKKATCKVKIAIIPVNSFELNTIRIEQKKGTNFQLTAVQVLPENATYSTILWESTHPEVASVDENGLVSMHEAGMAVIRASAAEGEFVRTCLVFVNGGAEETPEGNYLTPQMFRTAEEEDDTAAFNKAINSLGGDCDTVYVPAGRYKINALAGVRPVSNMNLMLSPDAVLVAMENAETHSDVIYVRDVSNVSISGGQIKGERYAHKASSGEWGMGIGVYDSSDISISDIHISDCWGDGIYLGSKRGSDIADGSVNILVSGCTLYNNRRNNMSIVCADYVTVNQCSFIGANGTAPEYGIDIETNYQTNPCEHITISNSLFSENKQAALGIVTKANDILIDDCIMNGTFINYAGENVEIRDTAINGEMDARIGINLSGSSVINDGSSKEDILAAAFYADKGTYTLGAYNHDNENVMSGEIADDAQSVSGKVLKLKRLSKGTKEAGYYLCISELTENGALTLEPGETYRFEYVMKGTGFWGIKTDQTGWYPLAPYKDRFSTGYVTYRAKKADSNRLLLYAVETIKDMELEIESIKIYKIR